MTDALNSPQPTRFEMKHSMSDSVFCKISELAKAAPKAFVALLLRLLHLDVDWARSELGPMELRWTRSLEIRTRQARAQTTCI